MQILSDITHCKRAQDLITETNSPSNNPMQTFEADQQTLSMQVNAI